MTDPTQDTQDKATKVAVATPDGEVVTHDADCMHVDPNTDSLLVTKDDGSPVAVYAAGRWTSAVRRVEPGATHRDELKFTG